MDTSEIYMKMADCEEVQKACYLLGQSGHDFFYDSQKEIYRGFSTASSTWLPQQAQIQKMLGLDLPRELFRFIGKICKWILNDGSEWVLPDKIDEYYQQFTSMEQLWLAFYMHEKHQEIWDGEKWVKK